MQIKKTTFIQKFSRIKYLFLEINVPCVYLLYFRLTFIFKGLINNQGVFKYTIYSIAMLLKILSLLENSK